MGKKLHPQVLTFFREKIFPGYNKITSFKEIENSGYYIFDIQRVDGLSRFKVFFSDAYLFTQNDYYELLNKGLMQKGDFILIARPESNYNNNLLEQAYNDGFYIGKTDFLVKFLNNNTDYIKKCVEDKIAKINEANTSKR